MRPWATTCPRTTSTPCATSWGEDGRYINEYNYDWGGEGKYAQTQGEGKSTIITNFIAPQYDNAGP